MSSPTRSVDTPVIRPTATSVGTRTHKTRWRFLPVAMLLLACLLPAAAQAEQCPNEQLRREANSTQLPDCRAYELVSPPFKNGIPIYMTVANETSLSGDGITLGATGVFPGAPASPQHVYSLSSRTASGWSTQSLEIPQINPGIILTAATAGVSADLSHTLDGSLAALAPGAVDGQLNIYLRDNVTGSLELVATSSDPDAFQKFTLLSVLGGTSTFSHVIFTLPQALTPDAVVGARNLYDWAGGQLHLVSTLPNGSAATDANSAVNSTTGERPHQVSADGSKTFFNANGGILYARVNNATTVPISVSQRAGNAGEPQGGTFIGASADGSIVYFESSVDLTEASETHGSYSLYRYDFNTGSLTDLTISSAPGDAVLGAQVERALEVSEDGSYVYFTARGDLAPGATTETGEGTNIYVWHQGQGTRFIAQTHFLYREPMGQVSPNGLHLSFTTDSPLTSYHCAGCLIMYDYDYATAQLRCVSCDPGGATPTEGLVIGGAVWEPGIGGYEPNYVVDNGMVFFGSSQALVPQDTNGQYDVYEWQDGRLALISPGTGSQQSVFSDVSPDGRNVFFKTGKPLVGQDVDGTVDMYDARIGGGFPAPVVAAPCTGTGCQGVPSAPPIFATPPSVTFNGVGNFEAAPKPATKSKRVSLSRAQKLAAALRTCKRGAKKKRATCESRARKRYGKAAKARAGTPGATMSNRRGN